MVVSKFELNKLIEKLNIRIADAYQKRNGRLSFWFTYAPFTGNYVINLTFDHSVRPDITQEII